MPIFGAMPIFVAREWSEKLLSCSVCNSAGKGQVLACTHTHPN